MTMRLAWPCVCLLLGALACNPGKRPPITNGSGLDSGQSQSGNPANDDYPSMTDESEDTGVLDTAGCDPLLDPLEECGADMACDLDTLTCVSREGAGVVDDVCDDDGTCSPGLICFDGRCHSLCDPEAADSTCADAEVCVQALDPIPGVCRETCVLLDQDCTQPGDACNTGLGAGLEPVAVCTSNPGTGADGDACQVDGDCASNYLCTSTAVHSVPCLNNASACCTPICDVQLLTCLGLEPNCIPLSIPDQPDTGYCGA